MHILLLAYSGVGAAALTAAGVLMAPPAGDETTGTHSTAMTRSIMVRSASEPFTPPKGRWEATLAPIGEVNIVVENQEVRVTVNGQPLPPDRIAWQSDEYLMILDPSKRRQFQVKLGDGSRIEAVRPGTWLEYRPSDAPRVAIGVYTAPVPAALAAQLDLNPDESLLVTSLVENMPAFRSGIRQFDVITAIEDETRVTEAVLRQVVAAKSQGEKVRLRLIRRAQPIELDVEVQAVEPLDLETLRREWFPGIPRSGAQIGGGGLVFETPTIQDAEFMFGFGTESGPVMHFDKDMERVVLMPREVIRNAVAPGEQFHRQFPTAATSTTMREVRLEVSTVDQRLEALTARIASLEAMIARLLDERLDVQPVDGVTPAADRP